MKKYRAGKVKREHTIIDGLWPLLEQMEACEQITSIIPGPISPLRGRGLELTFQRITETGLRLLAKNGSAVQEVWVVSPKPEAAVAWLAEAALIQREAAPEPPSVVPVGTVRRAVTLPTPMTCGVCGRPIAAGSRAYEVGRKPRTYLHTRCAK